MSNPSPLSPWQLPQGCAPKMVTPLVTSGSTEGCSGTRAGELGIKRYSCEFGREPLSSPLSGVPLLAAQSRHANAALVHDVKSKFHAAVTGSAEDGALAYEVASLVRGKTKLTGLPFAGLDIDSKIPKAQTVRN